MCKEQELVYDIETLMREYGNQVLRMSYMYVKDYHLAEDIFQDVFIKVNQRLNTFLGESSIKTWLIRITINTCKDYLKSAYSRRVVPMREFKQEAITSHDGFEVIEKQEQNHRIRQAVMKLPVKYKDIIICIYFQEMTMQEAAQVIDIPQGTVKSRLSRAKNKMKVILEGMI
jgi:RNA polymerase sigma-70 factor, ECF subfamily